jgi:carbon monoxide dehydrogenase subunit G
MIEVLQDALKIAAKEFVDTVLSSDAEHKISIGIVPFNGQVNLTNLNAPHSYTIVGEGKGGVAGFAKGGADVTLTAEDENVTVLRYKARADVGGKMAQLGSRLLQSTSKKLAGQFFSDFAKKV